MGVIRIIEAQEARNTILLRQTPDDSTATPGAMEKNQALFGEPLTPDQVVSKIIGEVRLDGDEALLAASVME